MRKKLEGNGLWESSRLILPEHRKGLLEQMESKKVKCRPTLDEQKLQDISRVIADSVYNGTDITLIKYGEINDTEYIGKILQIDQRQRKIKISDEVFEYCWLAFHEIIDAKPSPKESV